MEGHMQLDKISKLMGELREYMLCYMSINLKINHDDGYHPLG